MSAFATDYHGNPPDRAEPLGQAGVRRFAGPVLAWFCLAACLFFIVLGDRSFSISDEVVWQSPRQSLSVRSIAGRIVVNTLPPCDPELAGWGYVTRCSVPKEPPARISNDSELDADADAAADSDSGDVSPEEAAPVKRDRPMFGLTWASLAMLAAIQPALFSLLAFLRRAT